MDTNSMKEAFRKEAIRLAEEFTNELWDAVVECDVRLERSDEWMRNKGSEFLRQVLGKALSLRAERMGAEGVCECEGQVQFRQRRPFHLHTVLAGRDVEVRLLYGQCEDCGKGVYPLLSEMGVDREGFTQALQELSLLAGVIEPYRSASEQLLGKFTGVVVSSEKIQSLVRRDGEKAEAFLKQASELPKPGHGKDKGPIYIAIDGGMVFVDRRWQEVKLGCVYRGEDQVDTQRGGLSARQVVAVRGNPEALGETLWPRSWLMGAEEGQVVVLGDGAAWIWNLAEQLFPNRVEILDWYHADENISQLARLLYGEGTEKAQEWREVQLDRMAEDGVDEVIEGLRFLKTGQRNQNKRLQIDRLKGYLQNNRERMRYKTFRQRGYAIGSGAVESAVSYVVQQRMKRTGMRWHAAGADAMLALRSVYSSTGAWDEFWAYRTA